MRTTWLFPVIAVGISLSGLTFAGERVGQEEARHLVEQGKMLPLERLLSEQSGHLQGKMLDVHLERSHGRLVYEIEVLGKHGQVREIKLDASNGELLKKELEH